MTLVELMVVIGVMVILLALALPTIKTALEQGRVREAGRQLNTYFTLAKAKAVETGRPAAVWIETEKFPDDTTIRYAYRVYLAETPPPYGGDVVGATMSLNWSLPNPIPNPINTSGNVETYQASYNANSGSLKPPLVDQGDLIQLDYAGPWYEISYIDQPSGVLRFKRNALNQVRPPGESVGGTLSVPYQILRQPRKSSSSMMELPRGTVVDLQNSGFGRGIRFKSPDDTTIANGDLVIVDPIAIMFDPSGSVTRILGLKEKQGASLLQLPPPTGTIHLLLGRIDQLAEPGVNSSSGTGSPNFSVAYNANLEDRENIWVSIGHQTGKVTTAENAWALTPSANPTFQASLRAAREFAQSAQSMGGR